MFLFIASCNNGSEKNTSSEPQDSETPNTEEGVQSGPTLPMNVVIVYHTVKDYTLWRPGFDADSVARMASGLSAIAVERSADKPNDVKIVLAPSDMDKAKAFIADPRLKEVMGKFGVISQPVIKFWSVVRYEPANQVTGGTRVEIEHKVKDFDAWVKVFDREGPSTRASNGLQDLALARGLEDPNLVHIVFEVTDMEKAKKRMADPALKKLMEEAGVIGAPTISFYNDSGK